MKHISSVHNAHIKHLIKLHTRKGRKKYQSFIVQGIRALHEVVSSSITLEYIYTIKEHDSSIRTMIKNHDKHAEVMTIDDHIADKISTSSTASGIVALCKIPNQPAWNNLSKGIVCADINDPGNMGTLIRTAHACNIRTVIVTHESVDPWSPKVVQSTAGTIAHMNIYICSWEDILDYKHSFSLYGLVVEPADSLHTITDTEQSLLVVGNEAHGLSDTWKKSCDRLVHLPMPGQTESLNAGVAGSIALYITHVYKNIS
jgi:TrmH family RNA methyltransferase